MASIQTTTIPEQEKPQAPTTPYLVDTDVHETLTSREVLLPYLDNYWQSCLKKFQGQHGPFTPSCQFPYGMPMPSGSRMEWAEQAGGFPSTVEQMRTQLFDGEGVTTAILNGFFYPSAMVANFEFAQVLARAYNEWQVDEWLEQDDRIRGSIHVVAQEPEAAAREIDRAAEHPHMVQVFLPLVKDRQYGDPRYRPIFKAAARHGLVVAMHHGQFTETLFGYPRYFIEWHMLAAPQAAMNQLTSLLFNGVLDELPDLRVALLETGVAWLPWFMWRADQQLRELRMEVPWVKRLPSEHIRDSVRISTQPMGDVKTRDFVKLVEMCEAERVFMFSTDYPHYDADSAERVLPKSVPQDLRDAIRFRNAVETYPRLSGQA
jgi:predicted TIM-barrel fold metal-dependent hydrolase